MNKHQVPIPPKHYPHFDLARKIEALRTQHNDFRLYAVFPVDSTYYLATGIVSMRVSLPTEIDKGLFEVWLGEQSVPDDFVIVYNIGKSMHDRMLWDIEDPIEYHCANGCGTAVRASDFTTSAMQRYEYCEACLERGE